MDAELGHIFSEVGIGGSSRRALLAAGIRSLKALVEAKEHLAKGMSSLRTEDWSKLLAVIKWRVANPTADVEHEFVDSDIKQFLDDQGNSSPSVDKQWDYICGVVGIPQGSREKLERQGVQTLDALMEFESKLESKPDENVWEEEDLWREVKEKLRTVIKWRHQNMDADVLQGFNSGAYETMLKKQRIVNSYIELALGQPFKEENKKLFDLIQSENLLDDVIKRCQETVMASENLRNQCKNFQYDKFIDQAVRHLHSLNDDPNGNGMEMLEKLIVVAGRTQSGKSSVKGVIQSLAGMLKLPLVVLTKGVSESIDLHVKLMHLCKGTKMQRKHVVVASSRMDGHDWRIKDEKIFEAFEGITHGGSLVIADTHHQVINKACTAINKLRENVPGGKFLLIVDEADSMFRTKDGHQVFEQALQQLLNLGPCMKVFISATPVPFMLDLVSKGVEIDRIEFFNLDPSTNYVGIEDLKQLLIDDKPVCLEHGELSRASDIPYTNDKVFALYEDAISRKNGRKGALLLDITSPYVTVSGSVKEKASAVQKKTLDDNGVDVLVVTCTGSGLSFKAPGKKWEHELFRKKTVGNLLNYIDEKYGLAMPVFIFGYSKMCRGISFRSSKRVPTHLVMAMGKGHNCSTIIQTIGRATFKGRDALEANGFKSVTILMPGTDHVMAVNYQKYIDHVDKRMQLGDSLVEAMTGANELVPDSCNFLRETFRELGPIKGDRQEYLDLVQHEEPKELSANEQSVRSKFWHDKNAQKLLRSIARLQRGHPQFCTDDAIDDLKEAEKLILSKSKTNKLLASFRTNALIQKPYPNEDWFSVTKANRNRLVLFMNPEFGDCPDGCIDDALEYDSSDDEGDTSIEPLSSSEANSGNIGSEPMLLTQDFSKPPCHTPSNRGRKNPVGNNTVTPPAEVDLTLGSEDHPIELSDDDSDSGIESKPKSRKRVATNFYRPSHKKKQCCLPKVVSDLSCDDASSRKLASLPRLSSDSVLGDIQRIAKFVNVNDSNSDIMFGDVVGQYYGEQKWWIQFDNGDNQDFDEKQRNEGVQLYGTHWKEDTKVGSDERRTERYREGNIPMASVEDDFITGKCIVQPNLGRRIHYAREKESSTSIAKIYGVDVKEIVEMNKKRERFKKLKQSSKLNLHSPILLPL